MPSDKLQNTFSTKRRLQSFKYAISGLFFLFRSEHNARIHIVAALIAIVAGWLLHIERWEWMSIALAIGLVFITELINSSLEYLADVVSPAQHEKIGRVKDLSAGAVLVAAFLALIIGCMVFIPKLI